MESLSASCFLCNEESLCFGARLITSRIPLSETTLAAKIELLLGDNFMIVVGQDDKLCTRCYKMVIKFDKLEADLLAIRKSLKGFLNVKYNLENFSDNVDTEETFSLSEEVSISINNKFLEEDESVFPLKSPNTTTTSEDFQIYHGENPPTKYRCSVCNFKSATQAVILAHLRSVHKSTVVFKCATCDKRFASRSTIQQHIVKAHGAPATRADNGSKAIRYRCGLCSASYPNQGELVDHFRVHREEPVSTDVDEAEITDMQLPGEVLIDEVAVPELPDLDVLLHINSELRYSADGEATDFGPMLSSKQITSQMREILPKPSTELHNCSECGLRGLNESEMHMHLATAHGRRYQCQLCDRLLSSRSNLRRHLERHNATPVMCRQCHITLPDKLHLRAHKQQAHPQEFSCFVCKASMPTAALLRSHESSHEGEGHAPAPKFVCEECGKEFGAANSLRRHKLRHDHASGPINCVVCGVSCADKVCLRAHRLKVHGVRLRRKAGRGVACDKCIKVFPTQRQLQRHKDLVHRPPGCRHCGKIIEPAQKLIAHERRHEDTATYPCPDCPKIFKTVTGLRIHSAVHTGQYRCMCAVCGKGFHSVVVHDEHMASHTKEALYTCERCGRSFSSKSTLRLHRIWHDNPFPYKCNICQRKFQHTSLLSVHKRRVHTGERPYSCPVCSLTFSVSSSRNKHLILHTRKFPHRCKVCGKGVTTRTKLARHMARDHEDFAMLNAKPAPCEYKMVLRPDEIEQRDGVGGGDEVQEAVDGVLKAVDLPVVSVEPLAPEAVSDDAVKIEFVLME